MITNFFIPELNNHDVQELWFQQNGATCHTARTTIDLLKDTFGDRLISRFGPVNWPPRSCDLTPLDYFLWSYVKSLVYADKPQTLDRLEDTIRRVIADIRPQMLEKVIGCSPDWTTSEPANHCNAILNVPNLEFPGLNLDSNKDRWLQQQSGYGHELANGFVSNFVAVVALWGRTRGRRIMSSRTSATEDPPWEGLFPVNVPSLKGRVWKFGEGTSSGVILITCPCPPPIALMLLYSAT
ncbi:DUF4817 domain-containing protein [Trichonephila clavipes]|nr:DUF4817 domain-containing protein [Trichonephila clavipes]